MQKTEPLKDNRKEGKEKPILLNAKDLVLGYEGRPLLSDLNFTVHEGDYLSIVGENGAGKSTLMRTILGLLRPVSGEVRYESGLKPQMIGYLPQQTEVQRDFPASVREIVLSGFQAQLGRGFFYKKSQKDEALENMKRMGVADLASESFSTLSGGQKQRVLLARALSASHRMLLLDEPVSGLSPQATQDLYDVIGELNKAGTTIVMISHDLTSAVGYSSHILQIGKEIYFGTAEEFHRTRLGRRHLLGEEKTRSGGMRYSHPM